MEKTALRPYVTTGVALLGAALIAVIPDVAPKLSNIHVQSPAVELASAEAFLDLANAVDPSASTDGLIGVANNLDSFLDLFGNPTVNVADTLATDFIGYLDLGSSVNSIPGLLGTLDSDLNADLIVLDQDFGGYINGLHTAITDLGNEVGTSIGGLDTDITGAIGLLDSDLSSDLSSLTTIADELGAGGALSTDLSDILTALGSTGELGTLATDITGVTNTLNDLFGNGSEIVTLLGYLTYLPGIEAAL
jgi:trimeric autotransporter adhesin